MKRDLLILSLLALAKLILQLLGNRHYGFHRDELLHLSVSEHLDWGYYEFPPLIAWVGKVAYLLFGYDLMGVRLFPTLAGVAILVLCCWMAKELGGKHRAMLFSGLCVLAFIPFYRNHTLFQPVAFDQLFWTAGFYYLIRFVNTDDKRYLLWTGAVMGLGLLNKYTMLVWGFGVFVGVLFWYRKLLTNRWLYGAGMLALLLFLPNMLWQIQHGWPLFQHLQALNAQQLEELGYATFIVEQVTITPPFILFVWGLGGLLLLPKLRAYRFLGLAALTIFGTLWVLKAKSYYVFGLYPVLFSAGTVTIEHLLQKRPNWTYAAAASTFLPMVYFIPDGTPILPIEQYLAYKDIEPLEAYREIPSDYADMFGWQEQVELVDRLYQALPPAEQAACVIWAENYGEAGALKILGDRYDLPNPISRHGSFWLWGVGDPDAKVWISLGNEYEVLEPVFEDIELIQTIHHPFAIEEEQAIPLHVCRTPKVDLQQWWMDYAPYVFN